jgi:hypothetical protein
MIFPVSCVWYNSDIQSEKATFGKVCEAWQSKLVDYTKLYPFPSWPDANQALFNKFVQTQKYEF